MWRVDGSGSNRQPGKEIPRPLERRALFAFDGQCQLAGMRRTPREAERAIAAIRAAGGDELVSAMATAFIAFAGAQEEWLARQFALRNFESVADGARALRISATQLGAVDIAGACAAAEIAGAGHDVLASETALAEIAAAIERGRAWLGPLSSTNEQTT